MSTFFDKLESDAKKAVELSKIDFLSKVRENESYSEDVAAFIVNKLIDDLVVEVCVDVHRAFKFGYSDYVFSRFSDDKVKSNDNSFFSNIVDSKSEVINCPKCTKLIHASRFAPHLETCMLQGRSSSRIASQRIANNSKECSYGGGSDEDDDWKASSEKSKSVKKFDAKRKKDPVRKAKPYKVECSKVPREGSSNQKETTQSPLKTSVKENTNFNKSVKDNDCDVWISPNKVKPLLREDKMQLFAGKCGVKSEHTGKYCGRSLRCHRHTDAERAVARKILAAENNMEGIVNIEDADQGKNVLGNFSTLNLAAVTPTSKKKEKLKQNYSKF